mgnify:CR=1 FL=1
MDITLFLAQAFGLLFVIGGLGMVLQMNALKGIITQFSSDKVSVMVGGFVSLLVGIPLILIHNVWGTGLEMIISVIVWATFLKGVVRVLAPGSVIKMGQSFAHNMGFVKILLWLMVILGGYLLYVGFGI